MNSLVVLLSVMALASAKPGFPFIIDYAAPALALAPAAVSHQSRIDVKSTPAIVKTDIVAPAIAPVVTAPIAYSAPLAVAPAAVSTQSRIDIKSSPGVISTYAAGPLEYTAPLAYSHGIGYGAPILAYSPSIYAAAIPPIGLKSIAIPSQAEPAPESPAAPEAGLPVAPTETPEVAAARAAHLEAKALEESHQIQKRSVGILTSPVISSPIITRYASPVIYSSPIARISHVGVPTPILTGAYGLHPY
ncbi:testis-specific gene A8 protein-like [Bicyclus anynana]|uniref:Testis-specific gene A8 protein-like n=1 Tax=Bicyclus anynana TaxID=110368 RepID=A0ABM3LS85_BICAN|nr:testis-specific gene A8 protein-like [Bicyclus anynana]